MKTILIFYEHVAREYESCIRLKEELEKDNGIQAFVFSLHFQMIDAIICALRYKIGNASSTLCLQRKINLSIWLFY